MFFVHALNCTIGQLTVLVGLIMMTTLLIKIIPLPHLPHQLKKVNFNEPLNQITCIAGVLFCMLRIPTIEQGMHELFDGWLPAYGQPLQLQGEIEQIVYCEGLKSGANERRYDPSKQMDGNNEAADFEVKDEVLIDCAKKLSKLLSIPFKDGARQARR